MFATVAPAKNEKYESEGREIKVESKLNIT